MHQTGRGQQQIDGTDDVSLARAAVARHAEAVGRAALAADATLVTSELVTNAVLHGGGCTGVAAMLLWDGLRIEVRDGSRLPPMLGRPFDGSLTGRGLRLVADLEGVERVLAAGLRHGAATAAALEQGVLDHTGGSLTDDMAAVVLHVPGVNRRP